MERIKVLHLIAPTTLAGAERVILNLVEHIDLMKFEPMVCSFVFFKRKENLFVNELIKRKQRNYVILMRKTFDFINILDIVKIIKKNRIDILHTHGYRSDIIGLVCARLSKRPVVSSVHGWTTSTLKVRRYEFIDRLALIFFNRIIAVSNKVEQSLIKAGVPRRKIKLLPNAIDYTGNNQDEVRYELQKKLGLEKKTKIVGTVARLSCEKGIDFLIYAVKEVIKEKDDVVLVIVGEGREQEKLTLLSERIGLKNRVIFYGFESNISKIYSNLDFFVLPSLTEGTPMALLEAMAFGVPVIASNVGEVPKIIRDGENGILVEPGNHKMLAEKIAYVLTHPSEARRMADAARKTIELEYDIRKWIRNIEGVYKEIVR